MVLKSDQERIKALLKDTITLLCRNGLTFKTEFSIEALIGITLDQDDVLLVNINEIVRNELGNKLAAAAQDSSHTGDLGTGDWDDNYSETGSPPHSPSHSSSKRKRKRRRSSGQASKADDQITDDGDPSDDCGEAGDSITGAEDASSLSEPPAKRTPGSSTSRHKTVKQENDDDDDSKDIVFIKEEVDSGDWGSTSHHGQDGFPSDLSGIPSSSAMNQQQENFDFLQGNSLIPMGGTTQQNANLWSDITGRQNITSPASKRTSTITSNPAGSMMGDDSQQTYGRTIYSLASEQGSVEVKDSAAGQSKVFVCNLCSRTLTTKRGFEAHMGQHLGIYRYKCDTCGKGFPSTTALRDHERAHTGQRLSCPLCFKQFSSSMGLKHHMKSIHSFQTHGIFKAGQGTFTPFLGRMGDDPEAKQDGRDLARNPNVSTPEDSTSRQNDESSKTDDQPKPFDNVPPRSIGGASDVHTTRLFGDLFGRSEGAASLARFEMMLRASSTPGGDVFTRNFGFPGLGQPDLFQRGSTEVSDPSARDLGSSQLGNNDHSSVKSESTTGNPADRRNDQPFDEGAFPDVSLLHGFNFK